MVSLPSTGAGNMKSIFFCQRRAAQGKAEANRD